MESARVLMIYLKKLKFSFIKPTKTNLGVDTSTLLEK